MKFYKLPKAETRETDLPPMRDAIRFLTEQRVDVRRPHNTNQLKLDPVTSFYPGKGTLFVDGDPCAWPEKGHAALEKWLVERGIEVG